MRLEIADQGRSDAVAPMPSHRSPGSPHCRAVGPGNMSLEVDAVRNLGRWYTVWTEVGDTGRDPFDAVGPLAICAALAVTAAVRSPEWGDYWVATIASARRLQYGSSRVQAVADIAATATLANLPASIASREASVALRTWMAHWGQAAGAVQMQSPRGGGRELAAALAPAVASSVLSAARMDRSWAETWAATLATALGVPALLEELAECVVTWLAPPEGTGAPLGWPGGHRPPTAR